MPATKDRDHILTGAEVGALIASLARFGFVGTALAEIIVAGMTREAAAAALRAYMLALSA